MRVWRNWYTLWTICKLLVLLYLFEAEGTLLRKDILDRKEEILNWVKENRSKRFICNELSCKPDTLNSYLKKMDITYRGNKSKKGVPKSIMYKPASNYLYKGSSISSYKLKNKLLKEGIKKSLCESCGLSEWLGEKIPLELHHKDGDPFNNELDNLCILCPNCHAFTDNYRGRNIGKFLE